MSSNGRDNSPLPDDCDAFYRDHDDDNSADPSDYDSLSDYQDDRDYSVDSDECSDPYVVGPPESGFPCATRPCSCAGCEALELELFGSPPPSSPAPPAAPSPPPSPPPSDTEAVGTTAAMVAASSPPPSDLRPAPPPSDSDYSDNAETLPWPNQIAGEGGVGPSSPSSAAAMVEAGESEEWLEDPDEEVEAAEEGPAKRFKSA